jgi:hypothetical protein
LLRIEIQRWRPGLREGAQTTAKGVGDAFDPGPLSGAGFVVY